MPPVASCHSSGRIEVASINEWTRDTFARTQQTARCHKTNTVRARAAVPTVSVSTIAAIEQWKMERLLTEVGETEATGWLMVVDISFVDL